MSRHAETKVYVGDLARDASEKELERAFSYYGKLRNVWVSRNPAGFAFIEFEDLRDAEDAVRSLDGTHICGSRVRVEFSTGKVRPKPWLQRGRGPPSRGGGGSSRRPFNNDDKCYECGGRGHYAYDCPRSSYNRRRSRSKSRSRSPRRSYNKYSRSRSPSPVRRSRSKLSRSPSPKRNRYRSRSGSPRRDSPPRRSPRRDSPVYRSGSPSRNGAS